MKFKIIGAFIFNSMNAPLLNGKTMLMEVTEKQALVSDLINKGWEIQEDDLLTRGKYTINLKPLNSGDNGFFVSFGNERTYVELKDYKNNFIVQSFFSK